MEQQIDPDFAVFFTALNAERGSAGPIGELLRLLADGRLDPAGYRAVCERHGCCAEPWFRTQRLDLLLAYARGCVGTGGRLAATQFAALRVLRLFLHVRDGEFLASRPAEVAALLRDQLDDLLADAVLDDVEDLYQVELQALFGLGYDDYLAMTRTVFERVWDDLVRDSDAAPEPDAASVRRKLADLEPLVRMATARPRSLGALYR